MKSHYLRNIAGATIMAFSLILGISSKTTVQAQDRYQYDQYRRQQDEQSRRDQQDRWRKDQNDRWNRGRNQDRWGRGRSGDGYPNWGSNYDLRQTALNAGYNEGIKQGRKDRGHGYGNDFRGYSSYQNATKDYNSRFGDRELYRRYFQMAYETGYADGLRGY